METRHLGLMRFGNALELMMTTHEQVASDPQHPGVILVVEHPPVVTMGNRELAHDLKVNPEFLSTRGVDFHQIDRGGSVTVHEPGQVVIYPVIRLGQNLSVRRFVWCLEEAMILTAAQFGVTAARDPINAGVWVGNNKLGAIGIRVSQHVTRHGLAFNATNSLETFQWVVPCGLQERGVTSLQRELLKTNAHAQLSKISSMNIGVSIARQISCLLGS